MKNEKKVRIIYAAVIITSLLFLTVNSSQMMYADTAPRRAGQYGAYDSASKIVVMYGGQKDLGEVNWVFDTWSFDYNTNTWTKMEPAVTPYATFTPLVYDSESDMIIAYGGAHADHVASNQTWTYDYDTNTWSNAEPSTTPPLGLGGGDAVYDSESDVMILHGGGLTKDSNPDGGNILINQTWAYDYNTNAWINKTTALDPIGRNSLQMAYDSESDRVIVFGGCSRWLTCATDPTGDTLGQGTWAYDYNTNTWEEISVSTSPDPRYGHAMEYDSESDRVIMFGGYTHLDPTGMTDETWAFDYNTATWTQLNPEGDLERRWAEMVYDSDNDKILLFGGFDPDAQFEYLNEVWAFDYNENTWTLVTDKASFSLISFIISLNLIVIAILLRRRVKK